MTYPQTEVDNGLILLKNEIIRQIDDCCSSYDVLRMVGMLRGVRLIFKATHYSYKGCELAERLEDKLVDCGVRRWQQQWLILESAIREVGREFLEDK